jgi:hypothetical protein
MRGRRLNWLRDDIKELFPYQESLQFTRSGAHKSLYLSRSPFPPHVFSESMLDPKRVKLLGERGLAAVIVTRLPSEQGMIAVLATAAAGLDRRKSRRRSRSGIHRPTEAPPIDALEALDDRGIEGSTEPSEVEAIVNGTAGS